MSKRDDVILVGFGAFEVVRRKARKGGNPRTDKSIRIIATHAPKFVLGKSFKDAVK